MIRVSEHGISSSAGATLIIVCLCNFLTLERGRASQLTNDELAAHRRGPVPSQENRALRACAAFRGDVLLVRSENDSIIPHPVLTNYRTAFEAPHSLTYRLIEGADHGLSEEVWQQAYTSLLVNWATEMVLGAREEGTAPEVHTHTGPSPVRQTPRPA